MLDIQRTLLHRVPDVLIRRIWVGTVGFLAGNMLGLMNLGVSWIPWRYIDL